MLYIKKKMKEREREKGKSSRGKQYLSGRRDDGL